MAAANLHNLENLHAELVSLLVRARGRVEREVEAILRDEDAKLTFTHWCVLRELSTSEGLAMGELHRATSVNDSTLTKIADSLVSRGLAFRIADPQDRRRVLICLSGNGSALLARLKSKIEDRQKEFIPGGDPKVLFGVVRYLTTLAA